jgi:hypothetical protein
MKALMSEVADFADYGCINMTTDVDKERNDSPHNLNKFIRCPDCGEQIIMVPNLGDMIEAIENHLATHGEPLKPDALGCPRAPKIEDDLTVQVLQRAAEISGALNRNSTWVNLE